MLQRFLIITFTLCSLCSLSATAQWQQTGSKVRYVNGLGIPTKDTAAGVAADSSQILIRPQDSALYIKYKRTWVKVGGGTVSGTINRVPKFTGATTLGNSSIVDSASAVAMTINPSGNIGINNTAPTYKFDITANSGDQLRLNTPTGQRFTQLYFANNLTAKGSLWLDNTDSFFEVFGYSGIGIKLSTNEIERMRITSAGNALIGTTSDNGVDKLQVSGSATITTGLQAATTSGNVSLRNTATTYPVNITTGTTSGIGMYQDAGTAVIIGTNAAVTAMSPISIRGTEVDLDGNLKVNAAGRVLIGNPTPNDITGEALQVSGAIICDQFKLWGLNTAPATASSTGTLGEIRIDANYIYICTATNTWKRVAIATW